MIRTHNSWSSKTWCVLVHWTEKTQGCEKPCYLVFALEPGVSTHYAAARCQAQRRYQATEPGSKEEGRKEGKEESKKGGSEITTKKKNGRTTAATISYNFFLESRPASSTTQWCNQFDNYPWPEFCGQLQWGARFVTARLAAALGVEYWFDWFPFVWESLLRIFCTHPARC